MIVCMGPSLPLIRATAVAAAWLIGRATKLERLGLATRIAPGCWTLKPDLELYVADKRRESQAASESLIDSS